MALLAALRISMFPTRFRRMAAVGVCALSMASGCTSPSASAQKPPIVMSASPAPPLESLHLPIETYMPTPTQSAQLDWVNRAAIRSCMVRFGLDYPVPAKPATDSSVITSAYSVLYRRYGVTDLDTVSQWGYHLRRQTGTTAPTGEPQRIGDMSPEALIVLTGTDPTTQAPATMYKGQPVPKNGCLTELERVMTARRWQATGLVNEIKAKSFTDSLADGRVTAIFQKWSNCMKLRGYELTDPLHAASAPSVSAAEPSGAEIAQAKADVACKLETNLVGVWFAAESSYQQAAIAEHSKELKEIKAALDAQVAEVKILVGKFPG